MRITKFWAKGYRSLRDVTLDPLGDFNIFYGPNGSGKSNVLAAMRALFDLASVIGRLGSDLRATTDVRNTIWPAFVKGAGKLAMDRNLLNPRDLCVGEPTHRFVLGAVCRSVERKGVDLDLAVGRTIHEELTIEIVADWTIATEPRLILSKLVLDGEDATAISWQIQESYLELVAFLIRLPSMAFALVDADRTPHPEQVERPSSSVDDVVAWHLREGRLKNAVFSAQNSTDPQMRGRSREFRRLLEGEPLLRPPFDVVQDPRTQEVDLREPLAGGDVSIDLMGLGIAEIYAVLAGVLFSGARAVGVEEPESHLHAPTTGRHLRTLLQRLVNEKYISQLFVATHSNLFDLDPTGYWDVSVVDGETKVKRSSLEEIDAQHLVEPGPAKRILAEMLRRYGRPNEVAFRGDGGRPITCQEMLDLLQQDKPEAMDFLRSIHAAAIETVGLRARGKVP